MNSSNLKLKSDFGSGYFKPNLILGSYFDEFVPGGGIATNLPGRACCCWRAIIRHVFAGDPWGERP
jgi:hypothetical protein